MPELRRCRCPPRGLVPRGGLLDLPRLPPLPPTERCDVRPGVASRRGARPRRWHRTCLVPPSGVLAKEDAICLKQPVALGIPEPWLDCHRDKPECSAIADHVLRKGLALIERHERKLHLQAD